MSTRTEAQTTRSQVAKASAKLRKITAEIAKLEGLYDERNLLFAHLADLGLTRKQIGEVAGVSADAVFKALRKRP